MADTKVEILKDCRFYLEKLILCSSDRPQLRPGLLSMPKIVKNILLVTPMLVTLFCLMRFVIISGFNLNTASSTFAISLGITQLALIYISLAVNRNITYETMCQMQALVDYRCRLSQHSIDIYKEAEENNAKMIVRVRKFLIIGLYSCYLPSLFVPISFLIFHFPKQEQWMLPFKGGVADEHTYFGYYISWSVQFFGGVNYLIVFAVILVMEIGFCQFIDICSNDLQYISENFEENDLIDTKRTKAKLKEAIELHNEILSIGDKLQTILAGSFFFQMVVCATFLAVILLSLDQNRKGFTLDAVINVFSLLLEIMLNFTSCNHAQTLTDRLEEVAENFYNILWYRLPCEQQKMIAMTILRAQVPFHLQGYKLFTCSMETFLAMIRASFSYYLVLDQIKT